MLILTVPGTEFFNEELEEFVTVGETQLQLEHSLVSLSKWESEWEKPYLGKDKKTTQEVLSYIEAMCLTPDVPPEVFASLSEENYQEINDYMHAKKTASWIRESPSPSSTTETITSELIYYWMITLDIPLEAQHWHLNRLLMLIRVVNHKNTPPKKKSPGELAAERRAMNQKRREEYGTTG